VTGDEKWIHFDPKRKKSSRVHLDQPAASTLKRNIPGHKTLLCIRGDQEGVLYYELLRPNEIVTTDSYNRNYAD